MGNLWDLSKLQAGVDIMVQGDTLPMMFRNAVKERSDKVWMRQKELGIWRSWSWTQTDTAMREIAHGLLAMGFAPGETASIRSQRHLPHRCRIPSAVPVRRLGHGGAVCRRRRATGQGTGRARAVAQAAQDYCV
jgi:hypothetical protein